MNLEARIIYNDKEVKETYKEELGHFVFNEELKDIASRIKVTNFISDKEVTISYMFDTDYLPRRMSLTKNKPLEIKDFIGTSLVIIILEIR